MRSLGRFVVTIVVTLVILGLLAAGIGTMLPRDHVATSHVVLQQTANDVWAEIADLERQAAWRSDLIGVETMEPRNGRPVWLLKTGMGNWAVEVTEVSPPYRFVTTVADTSQGFGGSWTYDIEPDAGGTRVTITERGFISSPIFRFLARFVFGLHGTQDRFLRDLGRHFGETVTPVRND